MRKPTIRSVLMSTAVLAGVGLVSSIASSQSSSTPAPDATLLALRTSCDVKFLGPLTYTLEDCFTSMSDLEAWLANTRDTTNLQPVMVDIGPGTFDSFECDGFEQLTLRGSGRNQTVIETAGTPNGMNFTQCDQVHVQDLSVRSTSVGVAWSGPGESTWTNVDVTAGSVGWADYDAIIDTGNGRGCTPEMRSKHTLWSTTWKVVGDGGTYGWLSTCAQAFLFGSEVLATGKAPMHGFSLGIGGDARVYGGLVKVTVTEVGEDSAFGIRSGSGTSQLPGGTFHMHGGIIVVDASQAGGDQDVVGILSRETGFTHTLDTAMVVKAGGEGTAYRVFDEGGVAQAPLLQASGTTPPTALSGTGRDLFVETDCDASGLCEGGTETHLMVSNPALCGEDPWFDTVTGRCRNDVADPVAGSIDDLNAQIGALAARVDALENP